MSTYEIMRQVASETGISINDLRGPRRWAEIVKARRLAAVRLREAGATYPRIGRALNRHHTTAMNLCGAFAPLPRERGTA